MRQTVLDRRQQKPVKENSKSSFFLAAFIPWSIICFSNCTCEQKWLLYICCKRNRSTPETSTDAISSLITRGAVSPSLESCEMAASLRPENNNNSVNRPRYRGWFNTAMSLDGKWKLKNCLDRSIQYSESILMGHTTGEPSCCRSCQWINQRFGLLITNP